MNRKKFILIIIICIFVASSIIGIIFWQLKEQHRKQLYNAMHIQFKESTTLEYGENIDPSSLIISVDGGELTSLPNIDSRQIGEQSLSYTLKKEDVTRSFVHTVTIKDTQAPQIKFVSPSISVQEGTAFDAKENIQSVKDPVDGDLPFLNQKQEKEGYWIEEDVQVQQAGHYTVTVFARDKNGNTKEASYTVTVTSSSSSPATSNKNDSANGNTPTYINGILLVNKQYALPSSYGNGLDAAAYNAFMQLQAGAANAGYSMPLISGYRSYNYQADLYNSYVARDGQAAADRYSARPGHSEHQSGLAMDVGAIDNNYGNTPAGKWLAEHCADYGFILRYPQGKENITGYMYEPWHIRYVGVQYAQEIMNSDLTLEEYLGVA